MSLYESTTRAIAFPELPAPLRQKLVEHAAQHQLQLDGSRCWITHSVNPPSESFFGKLFGRRRNPVDPEAEHDTVVVLHRTHLVVGAWGQKRGAIALSLPLVQASIAVMSEAIAKLGGGMREPGMDISGFPGEHGRPGSYFVKLGEDPAGEACFSAVEAAIRAAKNG